MDEAGEKFPFSRRNIIWGFLLFALLMSIGIFSIVRGSFPSFMRVALTVLFLMYGALLGKIFFRRKKIHSRNFYLAVAGCSIVMIYSLLWIRAPTFIDTALDDVVFFSGMLAILPAAIDMAPTHAKEYLFIGRQLSTIRTRLVWLIVAAAIATIFFAIFFSMFFAGLDDQIR